MNEKERILEAYEETISEGRTSAQKEAMALIDKVRKRIAKGNFRYNDISGDMTKAIALLKKGSTKSEETISEDLGDEKDIVLKWLVDAGGHISEVFLKLNWALKTGKGYKRKELVALEKKSERLKKEIFNLTDNVASELTER